MFYSEAWGLVHFLLNRKGRDTSFGEDMASYIQLVESGVEEVTAFEKAFGITAKELETQVGRYLNAGQLSGYRMKIEQLLPDFEPEVFAVSRERASLALANLALRRGKLELAEHWYAIAASDDSTRAHAEAGLGDVLKFQDEFDAARPHFETALALAPDDPYIQLDVAEYWHDLAEEPESASERSELFKRARSHYVEAWNLDDTMPETYAMFGLTYLNEGQNFEKAVEMLEQAEYLLPSNLSIRLWLAEAYMGAGRAADAVSRARSVLTWSHGESEAAKRAEEILSGQASASD
jgi:tetratricopeptide (TPR) repeat protein